MRLQSAIEYLTTYGWALIILAVVLTALFLLGIFNGSNFTPSECLISSGFTCGSYAFGKDGTFNLNLQQSMSTPINITAFGCAQNGTISNTVMQKPLNPPSNQIFMPVGGNVTIVMKCYSNNGMIFQGNIGTVFSGTIIINYTNDFTNIPNVAIGKLVVKVSALSVTTASTISTTSTSSTSTSSTSTSTTVATTTSTTSSTTTIYSVPLTLTNSQSSATPAPFQQMITINSQTYQSYINSGWTNVEFSTGASGTGTVLQAWVESNPSNSATNTVVWVNLPNGIAGSSSTTIYMDFMSSNVMSSSGPTGEAPQLSASYGQYDNGNTVFSFYDNFAGTSLNSLWFVVTGGGSPSITVNNGLTFTAPSGSCSASGIRSVSAFGTNTVFDFYGLPAGSAAASAFGFVNEVTWASEWGCGSGATAMMYTKPSPNNELSGLYASDTSTGYSSGTKIWTILNGVTQIGSLLNYGSSVSATRSQSVIYNSMNIGFFSQGSDTAWSIQWVRVRAYPPGGMMPGASPALYSVPLTLTNGQSSATPAPFQQMITINSQTYQSYIYSGWTNVEFTSGNYVAGTPGMTYNAWVENNAINTATNTVVWVNLPNGIAGSSSTTIYMDFMFSNVMSSSGPTGEAPQLSSTYGQYDNGNTVFSFYDNFAGTTLSSKWNANGASYSVNNGLTYNVNSNYDVFASTTSFTAPYIIDYYGYGTATTSDAGVYFDIQRTSANSNSILWAQRGSTQAQDMFYVYTSGGYTQYGSWTYSMDGNYHIYTLEDGPSDNPLITQTNYVTQETYTSMPSTYTSGYFGPRQVVAGFVEYWQWVRARAYPPGGVMPSTSPVVYSVPLTLTNSQSSATPAPFQQMITVNSLKYQSYIYSGWTNVEFTSGNYAAGTPGMTYNAWVENNAINTATNTVVWVNLPNGIAGSSSNTIYMDFMSSNVMSSSGPTGEAPQLSGTYGQYDNGASVFGYYQNFAGTSLPTGWSSSTTASVNNGVSISAGSVYTTSAVFSSLNKIEEMYAKYTSLNSGGWSGLLQSNTQAPQGDNGGSNAEILWLTASGSNMFDYFAADGTTSSYNLQNGVSGFTPSLNVFYTIGTFVSSTTVGETVNYATQLSASGTYNQNQYMILGFFGGSGSGSTSINPVFVQWVRTRAYPPGGFMPGVSGI